MNIFAFALGSRGDVEPLLTLAATLKERGHTVQLAAPADQTRWIEQAGVPAVEMPFEARGMMHSPELRKAVSDGGATVFTQARVMLARLKPGFSEMLRRVHEASAGADVIVSGHLGLNIPASIGAARRIPILPITIYPFISTSALPSPMVSVRQLGPFNRATHNLVLGQFARSVKPMVDAYRTEHGLAPSKTPYTLRIPTENRPLTAAWSCHLVPMPGDYGSGAIQTGSIVTPTVLRDRMGTAGPDSALLSWIRNGSAPVFISFGSMPIADEAATAQLIKDALSELGLRGVLISGWAEFPEGESDNLYCTGSVDHDRLLPHCAAAIHHGGAGTSHASVRAGLPTLITSFMAEQPFWGQRLRDLGVGDRLRFKSLTKDDVVARLGALLKPDVVARAKTLGEAVSAERGLDETVAYVEEKLPQARPPT